MDALKMINSAGGRNSRHSTNRQSLGLVVTTAATATAFIQKIGSFIKSMGWTNDNGVIAARDKIAQYVTQVVGDRTKAYDQLYKGYSLAHADINNVGTKSYYDGVLKRLTEAAANYIINHAADSSTIFYEDIDPQYILKRFEDYIKAGNNIDHAFWLAFTGKKDPYDIRTGNALPKPAATTTTSPTTVVEKLADGYTAIKDAQGAIIELRDEVNNLVNPSSPQGQQIINKPKPTQAGMGTAGTLLAVAGGLALVTMLASGDDKKKADKPVNGPPRKKKKKKSR